MTGHGEKFERRKELAARTTVIAMVTSTPRKLRNISGVSPLTRSNTNLRSRSFDVDEAVDNDYSVEREHGSTFCG